jgi:hypothetical protein
MQIDMCCPRCLCRFAAPTDAASDDILGRVFEDQPIYALGDGETFEDMISNALSEQRPTHCPECGAVVHLSEESLGQLALTMLARM